jgi:uncharacterized protein (TIGR00255 family)
MTGFSRAEGLDGGFSWRWEVKSVNARGLDVRCRVPSGRESLEVAARAAVGERFKRGNFNITLFIAHSSGNVTLALNREILGQLLGIVKEVEGEIDAAPPQIDGLLRVRGVLEAIEEEEDENERKRHDDAMTESLSQALTDLATMRAAEGARLAEVLATRLEQIEALAAQADGLAAAAPAQIKARLMEKIAAVCADVPALPEERLAQEVALLIAKADVREEIDRLNAHHAAAGELIGEGGPVGRRLDFLAQEFNREANTLCSKSDDLELTRVGLELKSVIEQFREQVQNIE